MPAVELLPDRLDVGVTDDAVRGDDRPRDLRSVTGDDQPIVDAELVDEVRVLDHHGVVRRSHRDGAVPGERLAGVLR